MSRAGGWIIQTPRVKPLTKPLQLRLVSEANLARTVESETTVRDARLLKQARYLRIKSRLSAEDLRRANAQLEATRSTRRQTRRKELLAKIAEKEAKGEIREAESLTWHLNRFFPE